jgi:hypothetical protein
MYPGSRVLWGCLATPAILYPSLQLYQNGDLPVLSLIGWKEKNRVGGDDGNFVLGRKFPSENGRVRQCVVVLCCTQNSRQSLGTFLRNHHKMSQ